MIIRFRTMQGYQTPYVPGWDCHGLPIEHKIQEEIKKEGKNIREMSVLDVRKRCFEYAEKYVGVQSEQFQRLGILGDWDNPYLTMEPATKRRRWKSSRRFVEKGLVYRKLKPVPWSIANQTALADAELEYQDVDRQQRVRRVPAGEQPIDGTAGVSAGLDDHALDAAGESGHRGPSGRANTRWCSTSAAGEASRRRWSRRICVERVLAKAERQPYQRRSHTERTSELLGENLNIAIRSSTAAAESSPPITSPPPTAPAWFTPPPATAKTTTKPASAKGWRSTAPCWPTAGSTTPSPNGSAAKPSGKATR